MLAKLAERYPRGKTLVFDGRVKVRGANRALVTLGDTLQFALFDRTTVQPVVSLSSATSAILMQDDGTYTVTVPADQTTRANFPDERYGLEVQLTEGDTGETFPVAEGDIFWDDSPFS